MFAALVGANIHQMRIAGLAQLGIVSLNLVAVVAGVLGFLLGRFALISSINHCLLLHSVIVCEFFNQIL